MGLLAVVLDFFSHGGSYEKVVKNYFKAIEKTDAKLYLSLMADDYITYLDEEWSTTKEELLDNYEETLEDQLYSYEKNCGENVKLSYKIIDTYKPNKEELEELIYALEDLGFKDGSVKDAAVVDCICVGKGRDGLQTYNYKILCIKSHGKWCCTGGLIDTSWYSN